MARLGFWPRQALVVALGLVSMMAGWLIAYQLFMLAVKAPVVRIIIGLPPT